ncbi:hypothetical protein 2 [Changjiang tombus-like virus 5]|uniref:hypothetical protein 2 n=1 Tax=Changjiang tombus-like virus 5 TaxID=1922819 RepID=UPI00090C1227|nr:hypothetical protein 2 [Changjiang tombus-like virus 5]APG76269.1 hypothetical protein 2 [Changjiang tombus-like virus 5]
MYQGRRKEIYQRAADSLASRPLVKSDAFMSTFLKCEKIDFSSKPDPAPRVIQPRTPRYNVEVGRYLKPLEKRICRGIAEIWGGDTILKGKNAEQSAVSLRQMWDQFDEPVAVGIDATRFDQHVSYEALEWEHSVYMLCFPPHTRPKLERLLKMQLVNRGYARLEDLELMYEVRGRRMSGDMNTGMGNCLLMCAMIHWITAEMGVRCRLANNGDDCVLILEKRDLGKLGRLGPLALDFGFVLEIEPEVDVFEQICFCQNHPVWGGHSWVMCRDPRKCVDKDLVTVLDLGNIKSARKWCHAIGTGGLAMAGGLPVLGSFYGMLLRHATTGKVDAHPWLENGFAMMAKGMARHSDVVTPESRASFFKAFDITPDQQESIESSYATMLLNLSAGVSESPLACYGKIWQ